MPELPEVESVRKMLAAQLPGRKILQVTGQSVSMRRPLDIDRLSSALSGDHFEIPDRQAKFLILPMKSGAALLVHLGMTGRFTFSAPTEPLEPHTHVRFALDDGSELRFADPRRFGFVDLMAAGQRDPSLDRLGLDPLAAEFVSVFPAAIRARRAGIKSLLMNQGIVGGVGNIYATEALWLAGIHPGRKGHRISIRRLELLASHTQEILRSAIAKGGTTLRDFATPDGGRGAYAQRLRVYGREGEPCPRCGQTLGNMVLSNRSTVWCQVCQT